MSAEGKDTKTSKAGKPGKLNKGMREHSPDAVYLAAAALPSIEAYLGLNLGDEASNVAIAMLAGLAVRFREWVL
jgi:hypothetical protein